MRLITPLNRVLGLGTAKSGFEHWWMQRLTAAALVPLGLWLAFTFWRLDLASHAELVEWIRQPISSVLLILTALAVAYHSHLGLQVVFEDYVHSGPVKVAAIVLSGFAHALLGIAAVLSILRIAFGAP